MIQTAGGSYLTVALNSLVETVCIIANLTRFLPIKKENRRNESLNYLYSKEQDISLVCFGPVCSDVCFIETHSFLMSFFKRLTFKSRTLALLCLLRDSPFLEFQENSIIIFKIVYSTDLYCLGMYIFLKLFLDNFRKT